MPAGLASSQDHGVALCLSCPHRYTQNTLSLTGPTSTSDTAQTLTSNKFIFQTHKVTLRHTILGDTIQLQQQHQLRS